MKTLNTQLEKQMYNVIKSIVNKLTPLLTDEELNFHKLLEAADKTLPEILSDCENVLSEIEKQK